MDGDEDDSDKIHHDEDGAGGPGTVSNHGLGRYVSPTEMHDFDDEDDDGVLRASSSVFLFFTS